MRGEWGSSTGKLKSYSFRKRCVENGHQLAIGGRVEGEEGKECLWLREFPSFQLQILPPLTSFKLQHNCPDYSVRKRPSQHIPTIQVPLTSTTSRTQGKRAKDDHEVVWFKCLLLLVLKFLNFLWFLAHTQKSAIYDTSKFSDAYFRRKGKVLKDIREEKTMAFHIMCYHGRKGFLKKDRISWILQDWDISPEICSGKDALFRILKMVILVSCGHFIPLCSHSLPSWALRVFTFCLGKVGVKLSK